MYEVTKEFTRGILKGTTIVERTSVLFLPGETYKACAGSDYRVIRVVEVKES